MSKLVKQSQLREIVVDLWNKTKDKTDGAFKEASYSQLTQEITFTKENGQTVTVTLPDLVSKTKDNVVIGKTTLIDGYIRGGVHSTLVNTRADLSVTASNFTYFTTTTLNVEARTKISSVVLVMSDDLQVGTTVTGVNLGAVTQRESRVLPYLIQNGTAKVKENTFKDNLPGEKIIEIPVNHAWEEDVWLLIGAKGMKWGERPTGANYLIKGGNDNNRLPGENSTLSLNTTNWHGSCLIFSEETSLNDLPTTRSNNVWTGQNFIMDGYVMGGILAKVDNKNTNLSAVGGNHYAGLKSAQVIPSQTLSYITIGIHNNIAVGTRIDGIKVGAIKASNDELTHYVVDNASAIVQENYNLELTNCTRCVVVKLDTPFTPTEHHWFCITCNKMAWGERSADIQTAGCTTNEAMPEIGQTIATKGNGYMGKYLLHADKISLNNLASVARRFVRSVNAQVPNDQGEIVIGINDIENLQAGLNSKLNASEVALEANKIPRLDQNGKIPTSILPQVAITDVHTVATKQEALNLITNGTCHPAHIVIITGENNNIYICKTIQGSSFDDRFIKLSLADGTVKNVNGQMPNAQGQVTISANDIADVYSKQESDAKFFAYTYDQIDDANDFKDLTKVARTKQGTRNLPTSNSTSGVIQFFKDKDNHGLQMWHTTEGSTVGEYWTRIVTNGNWSTWKRIAIADDLQGMVKSINGQRVNEQGEVTLTGSVNQNGSGDITISVGNNTDFVTLQCMTQDEVNEIKNLFV